ncbi:MAG: GMC oxidoreductase, partial [Pseudomonadota bacterium]
EMLPGEGIDSDEDLTRYCHQTVKTNYHPVGTAAMGRDNDAMAVLDTTLRVRGTERLRVIDCAAMPAIPSGNTNAPAMAFADRAVSIITGTNRPPSPL